MQTQTIKSYLYQQYQDDLDLQAFVDAYNAMTQEYVDWCNTINLPIYTGLSGLFLDWVGTGLYGVSRPTLFITSGAVYDVAIYDVATYDAGSSALSMVSDDVYQRVLTWKLHRGDGFYMNVQWLKRRIKRFLVGANGIDPGIDSTIEISITNKAGNVLEVVVNYPSNPAIVTIFVQLFNRGILDSPFQYNISARAL